MKRPWIYIVAVPLLVLLGIAGLRLHHEPSPEGVRSQLGFIRAELDDGAAARMQELFPEGYFFSYLLYGVTWTELARARPEWRGEALREALWALRHVDSARARETFPKEQVVPHGVFYAGWTAWLYARVLGIEGAPADALAPRLEELTQGIASALDESPTPFLQAYPGGAWSCDTVVAVAALAEHDRVLEERYAATVDRWLGEVEERLDDSGLLAHRVDPETGEPLQGARATSSTLIARFMGAIDSDAGTSYYEATRVAFITTRFGLTGTAEYPNGEEGEGDVDSGPLILGVSASASVVMAGAAAFYRDEQTADALFGTMELAGLPIEFGTGKRYGFGLVPVGDAFVAWASATQPSCTSFSANGGAGRTPCLPRRSH